MTGARLALPLLLVLASPAGAASFDCAAVRTAAERLVCSDPALGEADKRAAALFHEHLARSPTPVSDRLYQRAWLRDVRDKAIGAASMRQAYDARIAELRQQVAADQAASRELDAATVARSCVRMPDIPAGSCTMQSGTVAGAPGPALSYQIQTIEAADGPNQAVIVFREVSPGRVVPLVWTAMPGGAFEKPRAIAAPPGPMLYLGGTTGGTGDFPADLLFLWRDGAWRQIDIVSWLDTLAKRLPRGRTANKGIYPDWRTMTATTDLWRPADANCCPSAGSARLGMRLDCDRIVLDTLSLSRQQAH